LALSQEICFAASDGKGGESTTGRNSTALRRAGFVNLEFTRLEGRLIVEANTRSSATGPQRCDPSERERETAALPH
jgi:hypothetical protein